MLRRAHEAGVPLLCGTESGFSLTPYGEWHCKELEILSGIGVFDIEAIRQQRKRLGVFACGETGRSRGTADVIVVELIGISLLTSRSH